MAYVPGMPSNIPKQAQEKAQEAYKKQQEEKKSGNSGSSSSSKPSTGGGGMPSNVPAQYHPNYSGGSSSSSSSSSNSQGFSQQYIETHKQEIKQAEKKIQQIFNNPTAFSNPIAQQTAAQSFVNSLPSASSFINTTMGADASKILRNTNTAQTFNTTKYYAQTFQSFINGRASDKLPTAVKETIYKNASKKPFMKRSSIEKAVMQTYKSVQPEDTTFEDMLESAKFNRDPYECKYATSSDYVRMNKEGYRTVLIEAGGGTLTDKNGIYTIGRNNLSGVPANVKTIMVDKNNNWYYIANSTDRADFVETADAERQARCGVLLQKYSNAASQAKRYSDELVLLDSLVKDAWETATKTRKKEDIALAQQYVEMRKTAFENRNKYNAAAQVYIDSYAKTDSSFLNIIREKQGWSVTDEYNYQELEKRIQFATNAYKKSAQYASDVAAYKALTKRKEELGDSPVYLNNEAISKMQENTANMQRAVDTYNKWDSVMLHMEDGEGLGAKLRKAALMGFSDNYDWTDLTHLPNTYKRYLADQVAISSEIGAAVRKGIGVDAIKLTISEYKKAQEAFNSGDIEYYEYIKQEQFMSNQLKSAMFNNLVTNLDVFDLVSLQREYTAWKMAQHPERYSNDPKFQRLQEAYKQLYGTDFNGNMDKWRMAYTAFQMEIGTFNDYVYLDGSDLKYADGDNYGIIASILVGSLTDPTVVLGLGKKAVSGVLSLGSKGLKNAASDALVRALVESSDDITEAAARDFANRYSKELTGAARKSIYSALSNGDDVAKVFTELEIKQFASLIGNTDELIRNLTEVEQRNFLIASRNALDEVSRDIVDHSLILSKGTVVTSALNGTLDAIDELQSTLFKIVCPAVGAVTGLAKGYKAIQNIIDARIAKGAAQEFIDNATTVATYTSKQALSKIANMQFDDVFDAGLIKQRMVEIQSAFAEAALSSNETFRNIASELFAGYSSDILRVSADNYTGRIINELVTKLTDEGLEGLEKFAINTGKFNTFEEMYTTVRKNLVETMSQYSTDANAIIKNFDIQYKQALTNSKISKFVTYKEATTTHITAVKNFMGDKTNSLLSPNSVIQSPTLIQGAAIDLADSIYNFTVSVNPDWATFINAAGEVSSIHLAAQDVIDALDNIATGNFNANELKHTYELLEEYLSQVDSVYVKNLDDAYANALYDGIGHTGYLEKIRQSIVGQIPDDDTVMRKIATNLSDSIKDMGYTVTVDDIISKVFKNNRDLENIELDKLQTLYKVMRDKGSNTIAQIYDKNFVELTAALADSNHTANRTLNMYADALERLKNVPEASEKARNIREAIKNSSAVSTTITFSDTIAKGNTIDNVVYTGIMDSWTGNANRINSIVERYSHDQAVERITNMLVEDTQQQLARHNSIYPDLRTYKNHCANTVDVSANVKSIDAILAEDGFPVDDDYIDICFSMTRTSEGGAPKDIAFYVRGTEGDPFVLRQNLPFDISDGEFSGKHYGLSAENARKQYESLGIKDTVSREEFQKQLNDYITQQKEIALSENKTIRFIGFNSANGFSGDNMYLNNVIRSCGVNINTANAIDYAHVIRSNMQEYIIDDDVVADVRKAVSNSILKSRSNSITLGVSPVIAYDSTYTCTELLTDALSDIPNVLSSYTEGIDYIKDLVKTVKGSLDNNAYDKIGTALGMYIDSQELQRLLVDAGGAPMRMQQTIMTAVRDVLGSDSLQQAGLHKIIDTAFVGTWFDISRVTNTYGNVADHLNFMHTQAQRINNIYNSIKRTDLITDNDLVPLTYAYQVLLEKTPNNSRICGLARSLNTADLSATELYAATSWLYDELSKRLSLEDMADIRTTFMIDQNFTNSSMFSAILPEGRQYMCGSLLDYTDSVMDAFAVKYLNRDEAGYKFALALRDMRAHSKSINNIKEYNDMVDLLYRANNVHGAHDRLLITQSAAVYDPIISLHGTFQDVYDEMYTKALASLPEGFDEVLGEKIAVQQAVEAYHVAIKEYGESVRKSSIDAVLNLDAEGIKAHLVRNCGGGLVIDPAASCMRDIDLIPIFEKWKQFGLTIEEFKYTDDLIKDRTLYRVIAPDVDELSEDALYQMYNNVDISFKNSMLDSLGQMRNMSFSASDLSLMDGTHMHEFKDKFFEGKHIIDLEGRFNNWSDELYCCNMWTDADLKQVINKYYSDDALHSLAQSTHQVRKNITALHDLGTVMDNRFTNARSILSSIGVYDEAHITSSMVDTIKKQLKQQDYKICRIVQNGNKFRVVDFTDALDINNCKAVLNNTICIDSGTFRELSDWRKATNMAVKFASGGDFSKKMAHAYKFYKDTIRSHQIVWYLYGNIGTAVRNMVDSSTKGLNEVIQYNENPLTYVRNYAMAISDQRTFSKIYNQIELDSGCVDREAILRYFAGNEEGMRKFNLLYGYVNTSGGDALTKNIVKKSRQDSVERLVKDTGISADLAEKVRKEFDAVYASRKFRVLNTAEKAERFTEIHDACMKRLKNIDGLTAEDVQRISESFYNYRPTVESWGEKAVRFNPLLRLNQKIFEDAETRARLALYETFMNSGASESEAMAHVIATQFDYAGIGHIEDFMPFTQYSIYNALYWFDHADANAIKTAWRAAQYNDDASLTNQEIATMCSKYQTNQYYLYEKDSDAEYDNFVKTNLTTVGHLLLDGVDSYLGLPREYQAGAYDLNGTHYIKLGNSFVEETSLMISLAAGAVMLNNGAQEIPEAKTFLDTLRYSYDAIKYTPLYDKLYSPWKTFMDFVAYAYDRHAEELNKNKSIVDDKYKFNEELSLTNIWHYYDMFVRDKSTHSEALSGIPLIGAVAANIVGRAKAFDLNLGELLTLIADPNAQNNMRTYIRDMLCDITGGIMPSLVGTKIEPDTADKFTYIDYLNNMLMQDPTNYIDYIGRLQKSFGYDIEEAKEILGFTQDMRDLQDSRQYASNVDFLSAAQELLARGYTIDEIYTLFEQLKIQVTDDKRFLAMYNALPGYLKYDAEARQNLVYYYKALGMSTEEAWAMMISNPSRVYNGVLIELTPAQVVIYNSLQKDTYYATIKGQYMPRTQAEWDAYWDSMPFRYPKGEWKEAMEYLQSAGYSYSQALKMCLSGFMLNNKNVLVDVQGQARARFYSYSGLKGAEWDAYWATVPDYTKYEKGAFSRTMKALKKMGYTDAQARALIQQGIYIGKDGKMMNVTGMQRPVLGYPNFNAYYQTIPEYCRYEKGAFKRTYAALKQLGFNYDMSLMLIQQGAYLMDASMIPSITQTLGARRQKDGSDIPVTNITTLILRYGGQIIKGADGKDYMLIDCSGLTRPRKSFGYSRRSGGGSGYSRRSYSRSGRKWVNYPKYKKKPRYNNFYLRQPFVYNNNMSSYNGFTNYRGKAPGKFTKPYVTKGYVSTYSLQNFLNGASYGMRKVYKIDMRQYKSGAISTKSAYPAAYRNIAVGYRRNLYKDLYAKYGASRMQMRANQAGYSNASIVRLRRNEIQNRERYAERRDRKAKEKVRTRATR